MRSKRLSPPPDSSFDSLMRRLKGVLRSVLQLLRAGNLRSEHKLSANKRTKKSTTTTPTNKQPGQAVF
jgi:hypothetical protein